jgi:hypothetical protein
LFKEDALFEGKAPLTARKDLSKFLLERRKPFIKGFHIVTVNQTAQFYLTHNLHNTVHGGLLQPAIEPFLQAITSLGFLHVYYGGTSMNHLNHFLWIVNGRTITKLKAYSQIEFEIPMTHVNPRMVDGQRWNSQYTWGVSSMNIK